MRELDCQLSALEKSDGSAVFMQGDTKIICAVYGPAEVKIHKEIIDKATIECIVKPKVGMAGVKEKAIEEILSHTCEQAILASLHPRSSVQIVLQIMQDSGSLLSCLLNGSCMAMVHAGLPMKYMFVSLCCIITNEDEYYIDPTTEQLEDSRCSFTFAFETKSYKLISSYTTGKFSIDEYFRCLQLARSNVEELKGFQRLSLSKFVLKDQEGENETESADDIVEIVDADKVSAQENDDEVMEINSD